jgi:uncharacterized protein YkwD
MVSQMVSLDNSDRAKEGAGKLGCDSALSKIAYEWSKEQCARSKMSHDNFNQNCAAAQEAGFSACGENVAWNSPHQLSTTTADTHQRWMESSGHRANIMNPKYTNVGYGYYPCDDGRLYWTGFFGG